MSLYSPLEFVYWGSQTHFTHSDEREFDTWGLQYTHSGRLSFAVGDEKIQFYDGPCLFVSRPGVHYRYGSPLPEGRYHNFVTFSGERVADYRTAGLLDDATPVPRPIGNADEFFGTLQKLLQVLSSDRHAPEAVNLLERLLFLQRKEPENMPGEGALYREAFENLEHAIRRTPTTQWDFRREAQRIGISHSHFRRLFQLFYRVPPGRFARNCRFNLAAEMLLNSNLQIQEVAEACGFDDLFFFSKQFKLHYGMPPSAFRLRYKGRH